MATKKLNVDTLSDREREALLVALKEAEVREKLGTFYVRMSPKGTRRKYGLQERNMLLLFQRVLDEKGGLKDKKIVEKTPENLAILYSDEAIKVVKDFLSKSK